MGILESVIDFLVYSAISGIFLWLGMKAIAKYQGMEKGAVYCSYSQLMIAAGASTLVAPIPNVGWLLYIVVLVGLIKYFTEASLGEVVLMVAVAKIAHLLFDFTVGALL